MCVYLGTPDRRLPKSFKIYLPGGEGGLWKVCKSSRGQRWILIGRTVLMWQSVAMETAASLAGVHGR